MMTKAYAKINLSLDVTSRRDDGFHNLCSVMHSITLSDELIFDFEESDEITVSLTSNVSGIADSDNLIYSAATLYMERCGVASRVNIRLDKKIPIGAGLGGGSSDAAATLRAMNMHFGCLSESEILKMCAEIGSDVPFCYVGGTALCEGRGEIVTPIRSDKKMNFVIAIGDERISTPAAFKALDEKFSNFDGSVKADGYTNAPKICLNENAAVRLYNIFEETISHKAQSVLKIKSLLFENGADYALMTGSGPAVFGIFYSEDVARNAEKSLKKSGVSAFFAQSV